MAETDDGSCEELEGRIRNALKRAWETRRLQEIVADLERGGQHFALQIPLLLTSCAFFAADRQEALMRTMQEQAACVKRLTWWIMVMTVAVAVLGIVQIILLHHRV